MRISTFFYTLKQGVINIFRNKLFSLASIATISACLFLFGLFYAVILNFQNVVHTAEEDVSVTVFFKDGPTQEEMEQISSWGVEMIQGYYFSKPLREKELPENPEKITTRSIPRTRWRAWITTKFI